MATTIKPTGRVREQVRDALTLVDFAVSSGFKTADGTQLSVDVLSTIQTTAAKLGLLDVGKADPKTDASAPFDSPGPFASRTPITMPEWVQFELAYYRLAIDLAPVTAETLRNTEGTSDEPDPDKERPWPRLSKAIDLVLGYSPAQRFTRGLWTVTIVFALAVVGSEWTLQIWALDTDDRTNRFWRTLLQYLVPWTYGGLGACVYLLRSAHSLIYQRTFDLRRKPEYFGRIVLGAISGGAIILFVNQIVGEDGAVIQLSSAALGFLAGYSTDFLFSTLERVIGAILPRVGIDTVKRADAPARHVNMQADLTDLLNRYDQANGPAKDFYKTLIEALTDSRALPSARRRKSP